MIIETWVLVLIVLFIFAMAFICAINGMIIDQRLEKERELNRRLSEEKEHLAVENSKMRFQLNLIREKIEMEMKK